MDDIENDTITIDNTITNGTGGYVTINTMNTSNNIWQVPANGSGGSGSYTYATNNTWTTPYITNSSNSGLHVSSDAEFEGDIKWKGRSLGKLLEKIEDRLAILQEPDPEKLEKFAALKKAYDNYKLLEKLIGDDEPNEQR
jgi:hypothetical protein